MKYQRFIWCLIALAQCCPAHAADADLTELSLEELMQLRVIRAPKLGARVQDIPSSVSILTREDFATFGWRTLTDALRSLQGFNVTDDHAYSYAGVRGVSVPGDYRPRLQLLINGMQVSEPIYDSASLGGDFPVDVDLIDRIEVVRGPNASTYGGSAMVGVINVVTRQAAALRGGELSASVGSGDDLRARISYGDAFDNGLQLMLSASVFDAQGITLTRSELGDQQVNVAQHTNAEHGYRLFGRADYNNFGLMWLHARRDRDDPSGTYGTIIDDTATDVIDTYTLLELTHALTINDDVHLYSRMQVGRYAYDGHYHYDYGSYTAINRDKNRARWWGAESRVEWQASAMQRVIGGIEYQDRYRIAFYNDDVGIGCVNISSEPCLQSDLSEQRIGVYLQDRVRIVRNGELTLGVRFDSSYGADSADTAHWSPHASYVHQLPYGGTLKLLYATAFRDGSIAERFYRMDGYQYGDPNIQPELMRSFEATYERSLSGYADVSLAAYRFVVDRMISSGEATTVFNYPRLTTRGVEAEWRQRWRSGMKLRASYSYQHPERNEATPDNSPRHMVKINVGAPLIGNVLRAGIESQWVSSRYTAEGSNTVPSYVVVNCNLQWQVARDWSLTLGAYNMLNRRYADPLVATAVTPPGEDRITQDGRTFRVASAYRFR